MKLLAFLVIVLFASPSYSHMPLLDKEYVYNLMVEKYGNPERQRSIVNQLGLYDHETVTSRRMEKRSGPFSSSNNPHINASAVDFPELLNAARLVTPNAPKVGLNDIRQYWPHVWIEGITPLVSETLVYLPDENGNFGPAVAAINGTFVTTHECMVGLPEGCVMFNQRTQTSKGPNNTFGEVTYANALYLFTEKGKVVGVDDTTAGAGYYGNRQPPAFGVEMPYTIFENIVNPGSISTVDTFSTKHSREGGDGGTGANDYIVTEELTNATTQEYTIHIHIDSWFLAKLPATGQVILKVSQTTTGSLTAVGGFA